jgi:hypothetical protein
MNRGAPRFEKRTCAALALLAVAGCSTSIGGSAVEGDSGTGSVADAATGASDATVALPDAAPGPPDAAAPPDARPPCVEGDDRIEDPGTGACYIYFDAPLSWDAAEAACVALGGHLAAPTSQAENVLVSAIVPGNEDVWIGATDEDSEDDFTWTTGEVFLFDHWRLGEPNDGGNGEDCAVMEGDNNILGEGCLWDDRDCGNGGDSFPYLCERP